MSAFGRDPIPGMEPTPTEPARTNIEARRKKSWSLRICNGPQSGRTLEVTSVRSLIGRNDPPSVTVDHDLTDAELGMPPMISRRHAEVIGDETGITITDLSSTNGVFVDGYRIPPREGRKLAAPGAKVRLANIELEVLVDEK